MGQPRSEPHHRAQPWTEWRGEEGLSRARALRLAQPCVGSRGDAISLPQEQTPICLTFWSGSSAASIWGWRHLGGGSWVSVAGELRTSERRSFGCLGGGMQSPGSYWRPQSRHPSVWYLLQKPCFHRCCLVGPSETRQPCCWGWGPFPTARHCASPLPRPLVLPYTCGLRPSLSLCQKLLSSQSCHRVSPQRGWWQWGSASDAFPPWPLQACPARVQSVILVWLCTEMVLFFKNKL